MQFLVYCIAITMALKCTAENVLNLNVTALMVATAGKGSIVLFGRYMCRDASGCSNHFNALRNVSGQDITLNAV
jgi:hypothetical protein